jgi:two-component system response regulator RegA
MSKPTDLVRSILIADDDDVFRRRVAHAFRDRGWEVTEAADGVTAVALAESEAPEYAVVDLRLPDGSGLDVVRRLKEVDPGTSIVVLTGYGSIATALEAIRLGAAHYLTKPADVDDILAGFARRDGAPGEMTDASTDVPTLARVEWEHINRVLLDSGGNISEAARRLGLHRRSLQRKLAKFPSRR